MARGIRHAGSEHPRTLGVTWHASPCHAGREEGGRGGGERRSFQNVARTYILEMENGRQLETRPRLVLGKTSLECSLTRSNLALNSASESLSMA